jgi:hypothetical protein
VKLRDHAKVIGLDVGCGDNSCIWGASGGMGTNGGCQCLREREHVALRFEVLKLARVAQHLAAEVEHRRSHASLSCAVDYNSHADMRRLASLFTHDLALPTSTNGEVALGRCVECLAAEVERYDLIDRGKTRDINLQTEEIRRMRPVVEAAQAWQHGSPRKAQALAALRDAVDAYEKEVSRG